jgi:hypothetical protein
MEEIESIEDKKLRRQNYQEYTNLGVIDETRRIILEKPGSQDNGLFLFWR